MGTNLWCFITPPLCTNKLQPILLHKSCLHKGMIPQKYCWLPCVAIYNLFWPHQLWLRSKRGWPGVACGTQHVTDTLIAKIIASARWAAEVMYRDGKQYKIESLAGYSRHCKMCSFHPQQAIPTRSQTGVWSQLGTPNFWGLIWNSLHRLEIRIRYTSLEELHWSWPRSIHLTK